MEPLTTLPDLRELLRWQNITEAQAEVGGLRCFSVWPTGKWLPQIEFVFDHKVSVLIQLGFGPWHGHYEGYRDERKNFRQAGGVARSLINGTRCVIAERSSSGKCLGAGLYRLSQLPNRLDASCERIERLVFNQPVMETEIKFSTATNRLKPGTKS